LGVALVRSPTITILDLLLAISPFAALFPVFHGVAGQRKEVLLFALAALAYLTDLGKLSSAAKCVFWSVAVGILVAIYDGAMFFLPIFLLYLRVLTPATYPVGPRAALIGLPALGIFLLGYAFSSHANIESICATMEKHEPAAWCVYRNGTLFPFAASWLRATTVDGMRSVAHRYTIFSASATLLLGSAGLLPVGIALARNWSALHAALRDVAPPRLFLGVCVAGFALLCAIANDWNRWFYIATSLLTMIHFAGRDLSSAIDLRAPPLFSRRRSAAEVGSL
jgi:hypothetical protein